MTAFALYRLPGQRPYEIDRFKTEKCIPPAVPVAVDSDRLPVSWSGGMSACAHFSANKPGEMDTYTRPCRPGDVKKQGPILQPV